MLLSLKLESVVIRRRSLRRAREQRPWPIFNTSVAREYQVKSR